MKKNAFKALSLVLIFITVFCMSGCSLNFFSIESMLSPPRLHGKNGEVQKAFYELMSAKNIKLKTPAKGDFKSSFILRDLNGNGEEEALVFYSDSGVDTSVRLCLLESVNDTWVIASDIKGMGSGVYGVEFCDFNNDGKTEILVGWSLFENKSARSVCAYSIEDGDNGVLTLKALLNEYYTSHIVADLDNNGLDDLIILYLDDTAEQPKTYFRAFSFTGGSEMFKFSELNLDSAAISVAGINSDTVKVENNDVTRIVIDFYKTENSVFTEVVHWNKSKLKSVNVIKNASVTTVRNSGVLTDDIDHDGKYEVPVPEKVNINDGEISAKVGKETYSFVKFKWLNVYGDVSEGNVYTVYNPVHNYLFKISNDNKMTVRFDIYRNALVFYDWNFAVNNVGQELFSVSYFENNAPADTSGLIQLFTGENGKYYYSITEKGETVYKITENYVKSSFITNDGGTL